jgi:hypothetical protein
MFGEDRLSTRIDEARQQEIESLLIGVHSFPVEGAPFGVGACFQVKMSRRKKRSTVEILPLLSCLRIFSHVCV